MRRFDVAIVGAGPAGVAAALHLQRGRLEVGLIERKRVGGLVLNARRVQNYPGFPGGIKGEELGKLFREQLLEGGLEWIEDEILRVKRGRAFELQGRLGSYKANYLIVATGTKPLPLPLAEIPLYYEIVDLPVGLRRVAVVGGGDVAFDYALSCADRGMEVFLLMRSKPRAHGLLQEEVRRRPEIRPLERVSQLEVEEGRLALLKEGRRLSLEVGAVIGAIGRSPEDGLLQGLEAGENLFAVGSVGLETPLRHVGIAVGEGLKAVCEILRREVR